MPFVSREELESLRADAEHWQDVSDIVGHHDLVALSGLLPIAREIRDEMATYLDDPDHRDEAFDLARTIVRDRHRAGIVQEEADQIAHAQEASLIDELVRAVRAQDGPKIAAEAERALLADQASLEANAAEATRAALAADTRQEVYAEIVAQLSASLPQIKEDLRAQVLASPSTEAYRKEQLNKLLQAARPEVAAQVMAEIDASVQANRDVILDEERQRIIASPEAKIQRDRALKAARSLSAQTVLEEIYSEAYAELKKEAANREIAKMRNAERIADLQLEARNSLKVPFAKLKTDDLITISFAEKINTGAKSQKDRHGYPVPASVARTIHFRVIEPSDGTLVVIDDSWQASAKALEQGNALPDSALVKVATILNNGTTILRPEISRGMALGVLYGKEIKTIRGMEVCSLKIQVDGKEVEIFVD